MSADVFSIVRTNYLVIDWWLLNAKAASMIRGRLPLASGYIPNKPSKATTA